MQNRKSSDIIIWYHKTNPPPLNLRNSVWKLYPLWPFHRLLLHHLLNASLERLPQFLVGLHYVWVLECWTSHFYMQIRISILIRLKLFFSRPFSNFIFCLCIKLSFKKTLLTTNIWLKNFIVNCYFRLWYIESITKRGNLWYHQHFCRYHNIFMTLKTFDKLEISQ